MLLGHMDGLSELRSSKDQLLPYAESFIEDDETSDNSEQILYTASFEELAKNVIQNDTIIWLSISLLLVLAWGFGIIMLLYLPVGRYILQKDIFSHKLYVTPNEIVYKLSRPSFIPFCGITTIERPIHLNLVIDIIIEQDAIPYGIHTFRIESVAHGKTTLVDELQIQGLVIITEASKTIQDVGKRWKPTVQAAEGESMACTGSLTEGPTFMKSPVKSLNFKDYQNFHSIRWFELFEKNKKIKIWYTTIEKLKPLRF
ncbi:hypothetical protein UlMin_023808 [Ulmus minor]